MWSVMASGVWGSWSHCTHSQQARETKAGTQFSSSLFFFLFLFYYIWDPCLLDDGTHIPVGVFLSVGLFPRSVLTGMPRGMSPG